MNPFLLSFIKENFGSIFAFVVLCSIAGAYWLGNWRTRVNLKLEDLEPAREGFQSISEKVNDLWQFFLGGKTVRADSPLSLTELGKEISEKVNAKHMINQYMGELLKGAKGDHIYSAFEIQTRSMSFANDELLGLLSPEEKAIVEGEAFNRGMEREKILEIIGIELRDAWLKDAGLDIPH